MPVGEIRLSEAEEGVLLRERRIRPASAPSTLTVSQLLDGNYALDWSRPLGQHGIPQSGGRLRLEQNPRYAPIQVRGLRSRPGDYWSLMSHPQVIKGLRPGIDAVVSAGVRLEECPLPDHLADDPEAMRIRDFQHELCQRTLDRWRSPDEPGGPRLADFLWSVQWTSGVCGFAWYEYTARDPRPEVFGLYRRERGRTGEVEKIRTGGYPRSVVWLDLPSWRAPWAVDRWVSQCERLVGVEASFAGASEYPTGVGRAQVIFPRHRFLLLTHEGLPGNWEGRSLLRDAAEWILLDRRVNASEGLGFEVGANGELAFEEPPEGLSPDDASRIDNHLTNRTTEMGNGIRHPHGGRFYVISPRELLPDGSAQSERYNRQIALCLGSEVSLIALQQAGSYAARQDASADARAGYETWFGKVPGRALTQALETAIWVNDHENWERGYRFVPRVVGGALADRSAKDTLETAALVVEKFLQPTVPDRIQVWALTQAKMPIPDPDADAGASLQMAEVHLAERYAHIDFTPPQGAQDAARRALEVRATKPASARGMTPVGLARARDLSNGVTLSPDTVRRMKAYFDRHATDKDGATWGDQGKGWQAWMGWGGDPGYAWARKVVAQMDAADREEGT